MNHSHKLAIFGIGGIGASALLRAVSLGIECVAIDIVPWKLIWARELGIKAVHYNDFPADKEIFDFAIECSGNKKVMENAFKCIKNSGTAIIAGDLKSEETISIDPRQLMLGKTLDATSGGGSFLDDGASFYAAQYLDGLLPINKLITKVYDFDEISIGVRDLEAGKLIRGVIKIA